MRILRVREQKAVRSGIGILVALGVIAVGVALSGTPASNAQTATAFGPSNPFYAPSTLPFQAPPFDKIKDSDYQPAIEAGMAQQLQGSRGDCRQSRAADVRKHAGGAWRRSGQLLDRVMDVFNA